MFLKVDQNGNILGHDYYSHDDYNVTIDDIHLITDSGDYKFKYVDGVLVALSEQEILAHPNYKARKLNELKNQVKSTIIALDELKAHSLVAKKTEGNQLSQDEQSFLTSFISQRDALLAQYEIDKAQYE